jgi:hypothetical protein
MKFYRSARIRLYVSALALLALALQAVVLGQHAAAMAAHKAANTAEVGLISADLADLGLTLDDLPCHSSGLDSDGGKGTHPGQSTKMACPICTLHSSPLTAVLPVLPVLFRVSAVQEALPLPAARVVGQNVHQTTQARAPPRVA